MRITVHITRDDADVPVILGSIAHTATFSLETTNHRVVQLARDTAEAVAAAYLKHGEELRPRCNVAAAATLGHYACTRELGHAGPCAAIPRPPQVTPDPMDLVICGTYGCQNLKHRLAVFCGPCFEDYREDPDAYK